MAITYSLVTTDTDRTPCSFGVLSDGTYLLMVYDYLGSEEGSLKFHYSYDQGETWAAASGYRTDVEASSNRAYSGSMFIDEDDVIWVGYGQHSDNDLQVLKYSFSEGVMTLDVSAMLDTDNVYGSYDNNVIGVGEYSGDKYGVHMIERNAHYFEEVVGYPYLDTLPTSGTSQIRQHAEMELNHTGDGKTTKDNQPDFYLVGQDDSGVDFYKYTFETTPPDFDISLGAVENDTVVDEYPLRIRFNGDDLIYCFFYNTNGLRLFTRDAANTTTTSLMTGYPGDPAGLDADHHKGLILDKDETAWMFVVDTTNDDIKYITRTVGGSWGSWTSLAPDGAEVPTNLFVFGHYGDGSAAPPVFYRHSGGTTFINIQDLIRFPVRAIGGGFGGFG